MAQLAIEDYIRLLPAVKQATRGYLWTSYDAEADVLYVNFKNRAMLPTVNSQMMMLSYAMRERRLLA